MLLLIRVYLVLFVIEVLVYLALTLWLRLRKRQSVEAEWNVRKSDQTTTSKSPAQRDEFIRKAMASYQKKLNIWLRIAVFVVPTIVATILLYWLNYR